MSTLLNALFIFFSIGSLTAEDRVTVDADLHFKCDDTSVVKGLNIVTQLPMGVTCYGHKRGEHQFNTTLDLGANKQDLIVGKDKVDMTFINGNALASVLGKVTSGQCAGDKIMLLFVFLADDQKACTTTGLKSVTVDYAYGVIKGKCNSVCKNSGGTMKYNSPIKGSPLKPQNNV